MYEHLVKLINVQFELDEELVSSDTSMEHWDQSLTVHAIDAEGLEQI